MDLFCRWARENRVRLLMAFPGICHRVEYDRPPARQATQTIRDFFVTRGVPVLNEANEAMLPPDLFFDTIYHPTDEGQREFTRRLLVRLQPILQQALEGSSSAAGGRDSGRGL